MSSPLAGPSSSAQQSPSGFASPRHSTLYPIPSSTADALEARRLAFFQQSRPSATATSSPSSSTSSSSRPVPRNEYLRPGPSSASPLDRSRAFKRPPSALFSAGPRGAGSSPSSRRLIDGTDRPYVAASSGDSDVSARLYRQRFQQRCQAAMARERGRQSKVAKARGRDLLGSSEGEEGLVLNSDDLSSSDIDEEEMRREGEKWQYEDDELVRRVMLAEYRRLLHKQELSGRHELGWMGADEVAWLEEELARDEASAHERRQKGHASMEEPPLDMVDEDWALAEQFDHAFGGRGEAQDAFEEDEWDEDTLRQIEAQAMASTAPPHHEVDVEMDQT